VVVWIESHDSTGEMLRMPLSFADQDLPTMGRHGFADLVRARPDAVGSWSVAQFLGTEPTMGEDS
jgi:hypothetical protein